MIQRFLFDRIDTVTAGTAISCEYDLVFDIRSYEAKTTLAFVEFAFPGAKVALYAPVIELVPVARRDYARIVE